MNIHVVMGGPSAEFAVSLASARMVIEHLLNANHTVKGVVITRNREFFVTGSLEQTPSLTELSDPASSGRMDGPFLPAASQPVWNGCEKAFLALHGSFGEDGVIQGYLDTLGIPYTGSGVRASALAMDKCLTKHLYTRCDIPTPPWLTINTSGERSTISRIIETLGLPCFVKCPQSGSSLLMGRADTQEELQALLAALLKHSSQVLVEKMIKGIELSCGVLEYADGSVLPLPPVEIRPRNALFFDHHAKYDQQGSEELVPAPRDTHLLQEVQRLALAAHHLLGCRGVSRTDMIFAHETLYVLETNTLPGLTPTSLLPRSFAAQGGSYTGLLEVLLSTAHCASYGTAP